MLHEQQLSVHLKHFINHVKARDSQSKSKASHRQKRKMVSELGIRAEPYTVQDVLDGKPEIPTFKVVWQERTTKDHHIKAHFYMSENGRSEDHGVSKLVDLDEYDMVRLAADQSYIVLAGSPEAYTIELVVVCGVGMGCAYSPSLTKFLHKAVDAAVNYRRNVWPTHVGVMNQAGLNMGPRHARDIIGAVSLIWSIAQAALPKDALQVIYDHLSSSGLTLHFDGVNYFFPHTKRAPPEVYISRAYGAPAHWDRSHYQYAIAYIADRIIDFSHQDRQGQHALTCNAGGNYVNVELGTVVESAPGTLILFQPRQRHGTTLSYCACNYGYAITFSRRLIDGYRELLDEAKAEYFIKPMDSNEEGVVYE
ncbi:hypothetical protein BT96DRAFT_1008237 [Gymnopus androsaceus JB14]|uniref:Uncharacterized protein n=1 Tax=Gymnopus androsaceus JB14 TaxID=1447944 RepID=A0A6A4GFC2_9AGAR|nr:hypothetical protein BT96DRAFT_1008237 [Gymnopus androsaceus JB14]